jgi:FkbM family methyltransferase
MIKSLFKTFFSETSKSIKSEIKNDTPTSLAQFYGNHVPWELPVQYCASDCIKASDVVLDIGGHLGGVAIALSRLVAEGGRVYTFEPNREMWPHLLQNLELNNANNVSHIPLACFSESGNLKKFYSEPSFYKAGSGLMRELEGAKSFDVVTIAVDDFCRVNNLSPSFMKIDVEGAEIHVLKSAAKILDTIRLPIILEYQAVKRPDQDDPLLYLADKGYVFFDVNTYKSTSAELYAAMPDLPLVNVLCLHKTSKLAALYEKLVEIIVFDRLVSQENTLFINEIKLDIGRYVVELEFDCPENVIGGLAIKNNSGFLAYYEADAKHLKHHSCSSIVIYIREPQTISVEFIRKGEYEASLRKVSVRRIELPRGGV